jgi:hypothetical protein
MIVISSVAAAALAATAATPAPTLPPDKVPDVDVTPGVAGFIAIAAVAVITILLIVDMTRRIRRTRYRAEIRERLEAEANGELPGDSGDAADAEPQQRSALGDHLAEFDADGVRREDPRQG